MPGRTRLVVIADDLTGANGSGVLLRAAGLRTMSLIAHEQAGEYLGMAEALVIDAGTRDLTRDDAYARTRALAELAHTAGVPLIGKRVDSTLRGHVGAELDAVLDTCGEDTFALVVAAVPALGRITAGGYLLVDAVPLAETSAALDPWGPPHSSSVAAVVAMQSRHRPVNLDLAVIAKGADAIRRRLCEAVRAGTRSVIADATTGAHIEQLAAAARGLQVVPVDPGPFTAALGRSIACEGKRFAPVLAILGSVTQRSQAQLTDLAGVAGSWLLPVDAAVLSGTGGGAEVRRASRALEGAPQSGLLIVTTVHEPEAVLDLGATRSDSGLEPEEAARRIASGLAEIAARFLEAGNAVGGLYTTGGAVTQAVARRLGAVAIDIERSVLPLAVLGRLRGGPYSGLPLVSKGGLVGDPRAAVVCIEALQEAAAGDRVGSGGEDDE